ncbi:hypothetical protein [Armatimonas rosea]|uniref:Uncharacterized protein n=1 Tax=Armatimonas rosea TaxID=685828 RepID=A0A7W9SXN4_ARMRO|nr:hypothetical protein [Armatimonas rosea]MBB6054114.1 hypothetical protein [Armatimonas rosea]
MVSAGGSTKPVPAEELDRLQTHAIAAMRAGSRAWHAARECGSLEGEALAKEARENSRAVVRGLQTLGACESDQAAAALAHPIPFHALDTPDVRQLLAGLEALLPVAERVDAARGRACAEVIGGSAGLDLAEDLVQLIARISLEIHGPGTEHTGGRE